MLIHIKFTYLTTGPRRESFVEWIWRFSYAGTPIWDKQDARFIFLLISVLQTLFLSWSMGEWLPQWQNHPELEKTQSLFQSIQLSSVAQSCLTVTPWTAARQASLFITNSWSLLKLMSTESVMPSNHLILVTPFSSCLQSFPVSGSFQKSQSFPSGGQNMSISPSNEYSGLISFLMDWFDLLAVQATLKSLLQYHSSKASILQCSAFFIVYFIRLSILETAGAKPKVKGQQLGENLQGTDNPGNYSNIQSVFVFI